LRVDARSQHDAGLGERVRRCLAGHSRHNAGIVNHRTEREPKRIGRSPDIGAGAVDGEGGRKINGKVPTPRRFYGPDIG
jgi:hypothetical protein